MRFDHAFKCSLELHVHISSREGRVVPSLGIRYRDDEETAISELRCITHFRPGRGHCGACHGKSPIGDAAKDTRLSARTPRLSPQCAAARRAPRPKRCEPLRQDLGFESRRIREQPTPQSARSGHTPGVDCPVPRHAQRAPHVARSTLTVPSGAPRRSRYSRTTTTPWSINGRKSGFAQLILVTVGANRASNVAALTPFASGFTSVYMTVSLSPGPTFAPSNRVSGSTAAGAALLA